MKKSVFIFIMFMLFPFFAFATDDASRCFKFDNWTEEQESYYQHKDLEKAIQFLDNIDFRKITEKSDGCVWSEKDVILGFGNGIMEDNWDYFKNNEKALERHFMKSEIWYIMAYSASMGNGTGVSDQLKKDEIKLNSPSNYLMFVLGYYSATGDKHILKKIRNIVLENKDCIEEGICSKTETYIIADKFLKKHDAKWYRMKDSYLKTACFGFILLAVGLIIVVLFIHKFRKIKNKSKFQKRKKNI